MTLDCQKGKHKSPGSVQVRLDPSENDQVHPGPFTHQGLTREGIGGYKHNRKKGCKNKDPKKDAKKRHE